MEKVKEVFLIEIRKRICKLKRDFSQRNHKIHLSYITKRYEGCHYPRNFWKSRREPVPLAKRKVGSAMT